MTAVGKILVIINLLCSLLVGGLVTMVYVARTHWTDEYTKLGARYQVVQASEQTYKEGVDKAQKSADAELAKARAERDAVRKDLDKQAEVIVGLRKDQEALEKKANKFEAGAQAAEKEIAKRQAEVEKMKDLLAQESAVNNKLVLDKNTILDAKVAAEIQLKAAVDRAGRLETQLQELTKEMVRVRAGGGTSGVARLGGKNPPPDNIEGLIKNTDPSSNLVTLTIGSDAGLTKGHTLEVFRLSPIPQQSKYLGTIRILEVTATQAVGQPTGRMASPPQAGDRVASHILGG
jgi:hypothetical protein